MHLRTDMGLVTVAQSSEEITFKNVNTIQTKTQWFANSRTIKCVWYERTINEWMCWLI